MIYAQLYPIILTDTGATRGGVGDERVGHQDDSDWFEWCGCMVWVWVCVWGKLVVMCTHWHNCSNLGATLPTVFVLQPVPLEGELATGGDEWWGTQTRQGPVFKGPVLVLCMHWKFHLVILLLQRVGGGGRGWGCMVRGVGRGAATWCMGGRPTYTPAHAVSVLEYIGMHMTNLMSMPQCTPIGMWLHLCS